MKKRRSLVSRRSPDRTSPSGSGEPDSPPCQSGEPTSPNRCGGGDTSSAPRDISLIVDESSVPGSVSILPSNHPGLQEGEVPSAATQGKERGKRVVSKTGKKKSILSKRLGLRADQSILNQSPVALRIRRLFDEEQTSSGLKVEKPSSGYHGKISPDEYEDGQSDKTPVDDEYENGQSHKTPVDDVYEDGQSDKTPSVDLSKMFAQDEEVSCDGGDTSSQIMVEKKPKPSSGHHGMMAQDQEDGYSGKTPPMDLIEMITQDQDGQHSKKIGVHDNEENKQEQGRARGHAQDLLDVDDETILKKISYFRKMLNKDSPKRDSCPEYEPEQLIKLYERLALYRIRAYELTVDRKLAALDDVNLKLQYPSSKLYDEGFFEHYEESLEWYFDPELCKHPHFDDYQRITLWSHGKYQDWERYHSTLNTYEEDLAYVVLANEIKWIEDYTGDSTHNWKRIQDVVYIRALEIAVDFPKVSRLSVSYGFRELIRSMKFDHYSKGLDGFYFEIWKRVAKGKMSFREALLEVHNKDMFPSLSFHIKQELQPNKWCHRLEAFYDAHVGGIDKMASDDKAVELITEAVTEMFPRERYYLDYAKKKLDIAKDIGLISKGRRREIAVQDNGKNGKDK